MSLVRRDFLKCLGGTLTGGGLMGPDHASASNPGDAAECSDQAQAMLVDLTLCVGCRLCEYACKTENDNHPGPIESYDDPSVFTEQRALGTEDFTVINAWQPQAGDQKLYTKRACMHCLEPACVSACIVGALRKQPHGPVTYDAWKCIGCRYCMIACPFGVPTYSFNDPLTPEVRKCEFCKARTSKGQLPACVEICPRETMVFGKRGELLELARRRIKEQPDTYVDHIYGEHEVGGTSVMYLSPVPFSELGFLELGDQAPSSRTETIQHSVFKYGLPPLLLYGLLGGAMYLTKNRPQPLTIHAKPTCESGHGCACAATARFEDIHDSCASDEGCGEDRPAHHHAPAPIPRKFLTPGVLVLLGLAFVGLLAAGYRFLFGLQASTNLDQAYPWGLWIGIDVASGVALAAGGFTTAALVHVFHREHFHAVSRPALLTAMLGYTFVALGLQADLGRYYNVWHPMIMWQGNSALFEVGMCVMCYLNVLYLEFTPMVCERLIAHRDRWPRLANLADYVNRKLDRVMFLLVIAGCVLSCLHQSSLGTLMVIAPTKLHPLWWSPWLPLLFLLSAFMVGFPMVIWESLFASWSMKLKPEMNVLSPLARYVPAFMGVYLGAKLLDIHDRGAWGYLLEGSIQSWSWLAEMGLGVCLPMLMMLVPRVRNNRNLIFLAASLIVLGVLWNRVNVFIVGYMPPFASEPYLPSLIEIAVTVGLISTLMLCYRLAVTFLPVIHTHQPQASS